MKRKILLNPEPIAQVYRNRNIENIHYGWICVLSKNKKVILKRGDIKNGTFLRSVAKPIQAIPLTNIEEKIKLKELAIICGSHSASEKHIYLLKSLLKKYNLKLDNLQCGIHYPFDEKEKNKLEKQGLKPNVLHNNCSGKHIGLLIACKKHTWEMKGYLNPNHKIHKKIIKYIKDLSSYKKIKLATDGCAVPTFFLPIKNIAVLFSNFTNKNNKSYLKIIKAMTSYPFYVGGKYQIDTEIMKATKGKFISKVGGAGLIIVASNGNVAVVKIADGSPLVRAKVTIDLLVKLGWISLNQIKGTPLHEIYKGELKNHAGKTVGKIISLI